MKKYRIILVALFFAAALGNVWASASEEKAKKSTISLQLNDVQPGEVFKIIEKISQVKIFYTAPENNQEKISISFDSAPVDEAIKKVARLAQARSVDFKEDGVYVYPKQ